MVISGELRAQQELSEGLPFARSLHAQRSGAEGWRGPRTVETVTKSTFQVNLLAVFRSHNGAVRHRPLGVSGCLGCGGRAPGTGEGGLMLCAYG